MSMMQTRRRFLSTLSLVGAAGFLHPSSTLAAEDRLETTSLRLAKHTDMCMAPQFLIDDLLHTEGFTDINYVDTKLGEIAHSVGSNTVDMSLGYVQQFLVRIEAGDPITMVAGVMVGCVEVFAQDGIRSIAELKGKKVGVRGLSDHGLLSVMIAHVGLDPAKDIEWINDPNPVKAFQDGKIDAFEAVPPGSQEMRARKIGHVIVNNAVDRPWSDYFCCMLGVNREFVRNNPVATKRALRAFLKATDFCVAEPERAARRLVDGGFTLHYDRALEAIHENVFDKWREYNAEDTVRFYALRLQEVGFVKTPPQKLIVDSTDWRFFNELKRELKA